MARRRRRRHTLARSCSAACSLLVLLFPILFIAYTRQGEDRAIASFREPPPCLSAEESWVFNRFPGSQAYLFKCGHKEWGGRVYFAPAESDRGHYLAMEEFAPLAGYTGRCLVFLVKKDHSLEHVGIHPCSAVK